MLNSLPIGQKGTVAGIHTVNQTRRRLLDFGLIAGTEIEPLFKSPLGNPVAFLVRGLVIALRPDVTSQISVTWSSNE